MKVSEMREKSVDQLNEELLGLLKKQFEYRMQNATGQLGQTHLLRDTRRQVAKIKTILTEKKQGGAQ